jgi:hypothetical protein
LDILLGIHLPRGVSVIGPHRPRGFIRTSANDHRYGRDGRNRNKRFHILIESFQAISANGALFVRGLQLRVSPHSHEAGFTQPSFGLMVRDKEQADERLARLVATGRRIAETGLPVQHSSQ